MKSYRPNAYTIPIEPFQSSETIKLPKAVVARETKDYWRGVEAALTLAKMSGYDEREMNNMLSLAKIALGRNRD